MAEIDAQEVAPRLLKTERLPHDWMPEETDPARLDLELLDLRTDCIARANTLYEKHDTFRRYSLMAMATVPVSGIIAYPHYHHLTAIELRVERLRYPQKVRTARMYCGIFGSYFIGGLFFWPSSWGFRARAERFRTHSRYYDSLAWDASVVRSELERGTLDPAGVTKRDHDRRQVAREYEAKALERKAMETGDFDAATEQIMAHQNPEVREAFERQLMLQQSFTTPADGEGGAAAADGGIFGTSLLKAASSTMNRDVVYDAYGTPLPPAEADRLTARRTAAAALSPLAQLRYILLERRYVLDGMQ